MPPLLLPELPPQPETSSVMVRALIVGNDDDLAGRRFKADGTVRMRRPRSGEVQDDGYPDSPTSLQQRDSLGVYASAT